MYEYSERNTLSEMLLIFIYICIYGIYNLVYIISETIHWSIKFNIPKLTNSNNLILHNFKLNLYDETLIYIHVKFNNFSIKL